MDVYSVCGPEGALYMSSYYNTAQTLSYICTLLLYSTFYFTGFLTTLRNTYGKVRECRLKSTRKESTEIYILAKGFLPH